MMPPACGRRSDARPGGGGRRCPRASGFTLLEAVVALGILSAAMIVILQIRAQVMGVGADVRRVADAQREQEMLFQMLINGALPNPRSDPETGVTYWEGRELGGDYRITRRLVEVSNPVYGQLNAEMQPTVYVVQYTIEFKGRTSEYFWNR